MSKIATAALSGEISGPDPRSKYERKVRAKCPHFDLNPAAAFRSVGFDYYQRAAAANKRADEAEAAAKRYRWLFESQTKLVREMTAWEQERLTKAQKRGREYPAGLVERALEIWFGAKPWHHGMGAMEAIGHEERMQTVFVLIDEALTTLASGKEKP